MSSRSRLVRWAGIRAVHVVLRNLDGYVFLSEPQKSIYSDFGVPTDVPQTVIPNPVRFGIADLELLLERRARVERGEVIRLITVGALNAQKNHLLLLEALARLEPRFTLSIVGGGERESALQARIQALNLEDRVQLLGPREDVAELLDQHDLFVLSSDYEASPLVLLEAMVRGLPVVSTNCSPSSREHGETFPSYSVAPIRDAAALAAAVALFVNDFPETNDLQSTQNMIVAAHSPRNTAKRHLDFFKML